MKIRNYTCILAFCAIVIGFFAFGAVANAAETPETGTETFSYNLYYEQRFTKNSNYQFMQFTINGLNDLQYRLVGLQSEPQEMDANTDNAFSQRQVTLYCLKGDGLSLISLNVERNINKVKWKGNSETIDDTVSFSTFTYSTISTDIPLYDNTEEGKAAALDYLKTGKLPEQIEDTEMEAPKLVFTEQNRVFHIGNSVDGYNVQIQGRFYSVDDIEMEKKMLVGGVSWNYKYHTVLKGELTDWVSIDSGTSSKEEFDLLKGIGLNPLKSFLAKYPPDSRNIYGGKNSAGSFFSDRDKAINSLKIALSAVGVGLCQPELYVRFYYEDESGKMHFSKWTHWYGVLANPDGTKSDILYHENDDGLTDEDKNGVEDGDSKENDKNTKPGYRDPGDNPSFLFKEFNPSSILSYFTNLIKTLLSAMGNIAPFFNSIFGFLPVELRNVVYVTISAGCFCALIRFIFGKG